MDMFECIQIGKNMWNRVAVGQSNCKISRANFLLLLYWRNPPYPRIFLFIAQFS